MDSSPATIVVRLDGGAPIDLAPADGALLIGRGEKCALQIADAGVSRVHAMLVWREGAWWACDVSRNGTRVNGRELQADRRVDAGDRVEIAGDVEHSIEIVRMASAWGETNTRHALKSFVHVKSTGVVRIGVGMRKEPIVAPISERPGKLLRALIEARMRRVPLLPEQEATILGGRDKNNAHHARKDLREWWIALCSEHAVLDEATVARGKDDTPDILKSEGRGRPIQLSIEASAFAVE